MNYLHSRDIDSLKETKVINIMNNDKIMMKSLNIYTIFDKYHISRRHCLLILIKWCHLC